MNKQLIRALQQAHAIEIGAFHAYDGHWRSLPRGSKERRDVKLIQAEEAIHRGTLKGMLAELEAKPSAAQDAILWVVGKTVSLSCHAMSRSMSRYGARVMEVLGVVCYRRLAQIARDEGYPAMAVELEYMQRAEENHEAILGSHGNL